MPQANIWIHEGNWDAWLESGKSAFVNQALQEKPHSRPTGIKQLGDIRNVPAFYEVKSARGLDLEKLKHSQASKKVEACSHGAAKGFCKKGCK